MTLFEQDLFDRTVQDISPPDKTKTDNILEHTILIQYTLCKGLVGLEMTLTRQMSSFSVPVWTISGFWGEYHMANHMAKGFGGKREVRHQKYM